MIENLIEYLQKEINEEKISHAFLVSTNNAERVKNDISMLLQNKKIIPNQNLENNIAVRIIYPDNNIIEKNKILDLQRFIFTKSTINKHKIYFIVKAEYMNLSSFNKLLKVLEEPSDNVVGFLITEDESTIIPTIVSRCKKFSVYYNEKNDSEYDNIINKLKIIKKLKYEDIIILKSELLIYDKKEITSIIDEYKKVILKEIDNIDNIKQLANLYKILDNIIGLIQSNVNLELCLDKMFIEMGK